MTSLEHENFLQNGYTFGDYITSNLKYVRLRKEDYPSTKFKSFAITNKKNGKTFICTLWNNLASVRPINYFDFDLNDVDKILKFLCLYIKSLKFSVKLNNIAGIKVFLYSKLDKIKFFEKTEKVNETIFEHKLFSNEFSNFKLQIRSRKPFKKI